MSSGQRKPIELPTDLARAVAKVVRDGRRYGIEVIIASDAGGYRNVEFVDVEPEETVR